VHIIDKEGINCPVIVESKDDTLAIGIEREGEKFPEILKLRLYGKNKDKGFIIFIVNINTAKYSLEEKDIAQGLLGLLPYPSIVAARAFLPVPVVNDLMGKEFKRISNPSSYLTSLIKDNPSIKRIEYEQYHLGQLHIYEKSKASSPARSIDEKVSEIMRKLREVIGEIDFISKRVNREEDRIEGVIRSLNSRHNLDSFYKDRELIIRELLGHFDRGNEDMTALFQHYFAYTPREKNALPVVNNGVRRIKLDVLYNRTTPLFLYLVLERLGYAGLVAVYKENFHLNSPHMAIGILKGSNYALLDTIYAEALTFNLRKRLTKGVAESRLIEYGFDIHTGNQVGNIALTYVLSHLGDMFQAAEEQARAEKYHQLAAAFHTASSPTKSITKPIDVVPHSTENNIKASYYKEASENIRRVIIGLESIQPDDLIVNIGSGRNPLILDGFENVVNVEEYETVKVPGSKVFNTNFFSDYFMDRLREAYNLRPKQKMKLVIFYNMWVYVRLYGMRAYLPGLSHYEYLKAYLTQGWDNLEDAGFLLFIDFMPPEDRGIKDMISEAKEAIKETFGDDAVSAIYEFVDRETGKVVGVAAQKNNSSSPAGKTAKPLPATGRMFSKDRYLSANESIVKPVANASSFSTIGVPVKSIYNESVQPRAPPTEKQRQELKHQIEEQLKKTFGKEVAVVDTTGQQGPIAQTDRENSRLYINLSRFHHLSTRLQKSIITHEVAHLLGADEAIAYLVQTVAFLGLDINSAIRQSKTKGYGLSLKHLMTGLIILAAVIGGYKWFLSAAPFLPIYLGPALLAIGSLLFVIDIVLSYINRPLPRWLRVGSRVTFALGAVFIAGLFAPDYINAVKGLLSAKTVAFLSDRVTATAVVLYTGLLLLVLVPAIKSGLQSKDKSVNFTNLTPKKLVTYINKFELSQEREKESAELKQRAEQGDIKALRRLRKIALE